MAPPKNCPLKEEALHAECARFMAENGWNLVAHEWLVVPEEEAHGRGDLVFQKNRNYCVFECKRKTTPKVHEQALYYAAAWKLQYARPHHSVVYGIWTCREKRILGVVHTKHQARQLCTRPSCPIIGFL